MREHARGLQREGGEQSERWLKIGPGRRGLGHRPAEAWSPWVRGRVVGSLDQGRILGLILKPVGDDGKRERGRDRWR